MKIFQRLAGLTVAAGIVLAPGLAVGLSSGANPGLAGNTNQSDGTPRTCATSGCHDSFDLNSGTGSVTVSAPDNAVAGAGPVTISVTVDNTTPLSPSASAKRQGFEATVRDPQTGDLWGALQITDQVGTKYTNGSDAYVTHTSAGSAQTTWTFDWTPGAERSGIARVYVAANAADGVGSNGDYIYSTTADIAISSTAQESRPELAFSVSAPYPNPVRRGAVSVLDLTLREPGDVSVRVVDGLGRTVRRVARAGRSVGSTPVTVPTDGLAPGTYFVVVEGPGGRQTVPLAVAR